MRNWILAIFAALCYGSSTIFIKKGLDELNSPILGATIAQIFSTLAYGLFLIGGRRFKGAFSMDQKSVLFLAIAGILIAMGTFLRWTSLSLAPAVIVAPIIGIAPLITVGFSYLILRGVERVTTRTWLGAGFVVLGSALIAAASIA